MLKECACNFVEYIDYCSLFSHLVKPCKEGCGFCFMCGYVYGLIDISHASVYMCKAGEHVLTRKFLCTFGKRMKGKERKFKTIEIILF